MFLVYIINTMWVFIRHQILLFSPQKLSHIISMFDLFR